MKRFLILEIFESNAEDGMPEEEVVHDADTYEEAEAWIEDQEYPEDFEIEDTMEDAGEGEDEDELHSSLLPNPLIPFDRDFEDDEINYDPDELEDERFGGGFDSFGPEEF